MRSPCCDHQHGNQHHLPVRSSLQGFMNTSELQLTCSKSTVTEEERQNLTGQKGATIWLTCVALPSPSSNPAHMLAQWSFRSFGVFPELSKRGSLISCPQHPASRPLASRSKLLCSNWENVHTDWMATTSDSVSTKTSASAKRIETKTFAESERSAISRMLDRPKARLIQSFVMIGLKTLCG